MPRLHAAEGDTGAAGPAPQPRPLARAEFRRARPCRPAEQSKPGLQGILSRGRCRGRHVWQHLLRLHANGMLLPAVSMLVRHALAVRAVALCVWGFVHWRTYLLAVSLWVVSGLGVTAGAHRLWSHRSYKATAPLEALLMVMFSVADQGPIRGWALTHTIHHRASDTEQDPHNRRAGFWHAHLGWLFSTRRFMLTDYEFHSVSAGLGPLVNFHDRVFIFWDPCWSLLLPAVIAHCWGDGLGGLYVAGALRWVFVQHVTFFVNSMAHGECEASSAHAFDPGSRGMGPRVSLLTTVLALGEGWHDYHHLFPWDYAAAELGAWDQWNPTKVFIDGCAALRLAYNCRRCSPRLQEAYRLRLMASSGAPAACHALVVARDSLRFGIRGLPFLRYRVATVTGKEATAANEGCAGLAASPADEPVAARERARPLAETTLPASRLPPLPLLPPSPGPSAWPSPDGSPASSRGAFTSGSPHGLPECPVAIVAH